MVRRKEYEEMLEYLFSFSRSVSIGPDGELPRNQQKAQDPECSSFSDETTNETSENVWADEVYCEHL